MRLKYTQNDLPENVRIKTIALLNQQLADALDLKLQSKQAHWNVQGPHFISLHQLFDEVAEVTEVFADVMAERAVQLGGVAEGTSQVVARNSRLPLYSLDLYRGSDHLWTLSNTLAHYAATARAAILAADLAGDSDTADVFTQVSRGTDALLWKVSSHLCDTWDRPRPAQTPFAKETSTVLMANSATN
jgi:starvation-inducible DNA-binding protein